MRVLVTGASGFVGRALTSHLGARGHFVRAAARDPTALAAGPGIEPCRMPDLSAEADWHPLLAGMDAVLHVAGLAHQPPGIDEARMMRVNALAAGELAAAAAGAGIARFVLVSSIRAVAGPSAPTPLDETAGTGPTDAYGRSKRAGETRVLAALPSAVVLRPPLVHGAGAKANLARLAWLARLPLPLPLGGLTGRRSIVSDRNLASAATWLIETQNVRGLTFHIQDGETLTVPQMIAAMRRALGRRPGLIAPPLGLDRAVLRLLGGSLTRHLVEDLVVDDKALRRAGWTPVESSAEGLSRLALGDQTRL